MCLEDWVRDGRPRPHRTSPQAIEELFGIARRCLSDAEVEGVSPDGEADRRSPVDGFARSHPLNHDHALRIANGEQGSVGPASQAVQTRKFAAQWACVQPVCRPVSEPPHPLEHASALALR